MNLPGSHRFCLLAPLSKGWGEPLTRDFTKIENFHPVI